MNRELTKQRVMAMREYATGNLMAKPPRTVRLIRRVLAVAAVTYGVLFLADAPPLFDGKLFRSIALLDGAVYEGVKSLLKPS